MTTPERERLSAERRYELLRDLSRRVRGTLDLDEILGHVLDAVEEAVPCDAAGIFVRSHAGVPGAAASAAQVIAGVVQRGFDRRPPEQDAMLMSGRGIVGHVIASGDAVRVPDVQRDPRYVAGRAATRSEVAVPLPGTGETLGALNLESDRPDAFDEQAMELLHLFADAAAAAIGRAMLHRELMERRRIEDQMRLAQEVQSRLLPGAPPRFAGWDVAGRCLPTFAIGGDYFDHLVLDDDHLALAVADVSGKGVPAALSMSAFRSILRSQARRRRDPSHLANRVNTLLPESTGDAAYVTCVYGVLDRRDGTFAYSNCGHNPPLLARAGGGVERLETGGLPLGVFTDTRYETGVVTLAPGDLVVLYTDGVVEELDGRGEPFGTDRLAAVVERERGLSAAALIDALVAAVGVFAGTTAFADDVTVLVVRRAPA